jgi:single-strand DNA-binding protein
MINRVFLLGRLTADPEVKITSEGLHITSIRLVTNSYAGKDEEGHAKEHSEYHQLVAFGKQAENAGAVLTRGRLAYIEGRLQTRSWDGKDGQKHYRTEVVIETWRAVGPKPEAESAAA